MEEEGKKIKRKTIFSKYRIRMLEKLRTEADEKLQAIKIELFSEQENLERLEGATGGGLWAQAFEDAKLPNYEVERRLAEETK